MSKAIRGSRYHVAQQTDGRGWMLLRLDALGCLTATVIGSNLTESDAREKLADLRASEES